MMPALESPADIRLGGYRTSILSPKLCFRCRSKRGWTVGLLITVVLEDERSLLAWGNEVVISRIVHQGRTQEYLLVFDIANPEHPAVVCGAGN